MQNLLNKMKNDVTAELIRNCKGEETPAERVERLRYKHFDLAEEVIFAVSYEDVFIACRAGDLMSVMDLMERDKSKKPSDWRKRGASLLHVAVQNNRRHLVEYFLEECEIPINIQDDLSKRAPLHIAAMQNNVKLIYKFFRAKANMLIKDKAGFTPAHVAVASGATEALKALYNCNENPKCSYSTIHRQADAGGAYPIHIAARYGNIEALKFMIDKGVPIDCTDHADETPYHQAARAGHLHILSFLEEKGADKLHMNFEGDTGRMLFSEDARYSLT